MVICSLIVSVVSISNANAAGKCYPNSMQRKLWCEDKMKSCIDDIGGACFGLESVALRLCESSETTACDSIYGAGSASTCNSRPKITGGFGQSTLGAQDAYIAPSANEGNRNPNKNTFVPNSGLIAPPSNGSTRAPAKPAAPMNKPLVAPLVVPTKKPRTMPTATQPKMRTISTPTIQPKQPVTKQRVEKSVQRKVATPASTNKNKKLIRHVAPTTAKGVTPKLNQPVMRKIDSAPAVNGSKSKPKPTSKNNFDEADAIFGKRTGVSNTQAR